MSEATKCQTPAGSARIPEKEWPPWQVANRVREQMDTTKDSPLVSEMRRLRAFPGNTAAANALLDAAIADQLQANTPNAPRSATEGTTKDETMSETTKHPTPAGSPVAAGSAAIQALKNVRPLVWVIAEDGGEPPWRRKKAQECIGMIDAAMIEFDAQSPNAKGSATPEDAR